MNAKKIYTREELAEAVVFPITLTAKEKKEAAEQLKAARVKTQQEMTASDRVTIQLLQLKFQIEDYIDSKEYDPKRHFGYFLKRYIDILQIKRKVFAKDISVDETMLSQLINMHRTPPDYIAIRLELHSNNIIPAHYWLRLVEKEKQFKIATDKTLRKKQRKFVHQFAVLN